MLMDHADAGGDGVVGTPYRGRLAAHADFAAVGLIKTVENRHERRLAGAILTHYSVDASFRHFKIDVAISMDWPEALIDADQFDCGLCHALPVHVFIVGQVLTRHCSPANDAPPELHSRQIRLLLSISNPVGPGKADDRKEGMAMSVDRLTNLEIRIAEQERTIEELSGQLAEQWKTIDRLQKKVAELTERFLALEEQTAPAVPVTRPPHW